MLLACHGLSCPGRLAPLDLALARGEWVHLVGANGAGKSTLLEALSGLATPRGELLLNGTAVAALSGEALAQQRGWLPQQQPAPGAMPVWHYLQMHLPRGAGTELNNVLARLLSQLSLHHKLESALTQLSGGEWQRVRLLAVILQIHPDINPQGSLLLLDEPMSALDVAQQQGVTRLLQHLCAAGIGVITSSHDLNHTLRYADRVWLLHQGELKYQGRAHEALTAARLAPLFQTEVTEVDTPQGRLLLLS
ncbi:vitamin B12 ABC transporter ATP-binding protein BtuD [uncultured Pantoea sp.]|uniref:vitamin B12 ABC transporter ATP-binding protein BtuD n=1 Tax=uncultured Pantoea sp. TaxID=218084 RepID=UPI003747EFDB